MAAVTNQSADGPLNVTTI